MFIRVFASALLAIAPAAPAAFGQEPIHGELPSVEQPPAADDSADQDGPPG